MHSDATPSLPDRQFWVLLGDGDEYVRLEFPESVKRKGETAAANAW
jgi:hypothetical protein